MYVPYEVNDVIVDEFNMGAGGRSWSLNSHVGLGTLDFNSKSSSR